MNENAIADALRREWADERLTPAARERIVGRLAPATVRPQPSLRRPVMALVAVAAVAVALVGAGILDGGGDTGDVRAQARVAVDPGRQVFHYRATVRQTGGFVEPGGGRHSVLRMEAWLYPAGGRAHVLVRDSRGKLTTEILTSARKTVFLSRGHSTTIPTLERVTPGPDAAAIPPLTAENLDDLRAALRGADVAGPLTDARTGRDVYEITFVRREPFGRWRTRYRVDADTFAPVRLERTVLEAPPRSIRPRAGDVVVTDFTLVERVEPAAARDELRRVCTPRRGAPHPRC